MPEKFTFEKHQENMRRILGQVSPVQRPNVLQALLERMRVRQPAKPKLPRLPRV